MFEVDWVVLLALLFELFWEVDVLCVSDEAWVVFFGWAWSLWLVELEVEAPVGWAVLVFCPEEAAELVIAWEVVSSAAWASWLVPKKMAVPNVIEATPTVNLRIEK